MVERSETGIFPALRSGLDMAQSIAVSVTDEPLPLTAHRVSVLDSTSAIVAATDRWGGTLGNFSPLKGTAITLAETWDQGKEEDLWLLTVLLGFVHTCAWTIWMTR